jgi:hypothetical protein
MTMAILRITPGIIPFTDHLARDDDRRRRHSRHRGVHVAGTGARQAVDKRADLRRCLHKEPRQRIHDIADVRLALEDGIATIPQLDQRGLDPPSGQRCPAQAFRTREAR